MISPYLLLVRPQQWIKNLLVFLPAFFSGNIVSGNYVLLSVCAFLAFCLAASAIYCLNDIRDAAADRAHPVKRRRPIASGAVKPATASVLMCALAVAAIGICLAVKSEAGAAVIAVYLLLNVAYCLWLKRIAIVDVFVVSLGFVLRVLLGGVMCAIWVSPWIMSMTFLLALFLAFAKRRDDVLLHEDMGIVTRKNITGYNRDFLNQTQGLIAAITMMCYIIYTLTPAVEARFQSSYVYVTSIFVLAGILRYLQLALVLGRTGSPTAVALHDRFIQWCVVLWIVFFIAIIYV